MKLKLKTLSPLHIGNGKNVTPIEYVINNGMYYKINQNKYFEIGYKKYPDFPQKYSDWLIEVTSKIEELNEERSKLKRNNQYLTKDKNQLLSKLRESLNIKTFSNEVINDRNFVRQLINEKAYEYSYPVPFGLQKKKNISEIIKNPKSESYIPGSSIKGFIRTALLFRAFKNLSSKEKKSLLDEVLSTEKFENPKEKKKLDEIIQNNFLICTQIKKGKKSSSTIRDNIQLDILKFIDISDATAKTVNNAVYPANLYLLNKEPQTQTDAQEVIDTNSEFVFNVDINLDVLKEIHSTSHVPGTTVWIDFSEKFKKVFGFEFKDVSSSDLITRIVTSIKDAVTEFSSFIIKNENNWIDNFDGNQKPLRDFYSSLPKEKPLARLGWGSGFVSMTIFNALLEDEIMHSYLKQIFEKFKIGMSRKAGEQTVPNLFKFPKSKRISSFNDVNDLNLPFGWIVLLNENENYEFKILSSSAASTTMNVPEISEDKIKTTNSSRRYKTGEEVDAMFVKSEGNLIYVQLLDSRYETMLFSFKYANAKMIEEKKYLIVEITQVKANEVQNIKFKRFIS